MNVQLTISVLASDRPAALERCLDSLMPLMMQVQSQLIIVVTGTDSHVREIAARYTDQIIPFAWCGDFSAARNLGLQSACGEWFLYIDDDEWFEDVTEICDFFGYDIFGKIFIHHMNPILPKDIGTCSDFLLNPDYLITTTLNTHNAIHYGDEELLIRLPPERTRNDTCPWKH